jgi:hypothetical protein
MIRCLLQARRALDPPQRQLRQQQNNVPTPLRRQRLPKGLRRGAAHDAIQASTRLREAPCSPESATRGILSTYKRHLLWDIEQAFKELKNDLSIRPIHHQLEDRIEAHIFVAFLAYGLMVTLKQRLKALAPGLTPRAVLEKLAAIQMIDVELPTTDGRTVVLARHTEPENDHLLLLQRLKLDLPAQPPPKITAPPLSPAA